MTGDLANLVKLFQERLYLPDPSALLISLAAVAANLMTGNPVWLLLVGAGSCGKTEILESLRKLPRVHVVGKLSEAGLLSGTSARERTADATGGLLVSIGKLGIIVAKDFGSILNMSNEAMHGVLASFREIYDGRLIRDLGTDGGTRFEWTGKVGFIGGCTPDIDTRHAAMHTMGERFTLFRMPTMDEEQALRALDNVDLDRSTQAELADAVEAFMKGIDIKKITSTSAENKTYLATLASLIVRCRSATVRDSRNREIEVVPQPEAPARLALVLERFLRGLHTIGAGPEEAIALVQRLAFDSVPLARERILEALCCDPRSVTSVEELTPAAQVSRSATRRHLEDLEAYRIVDVGRGVTPHTYALSSWAQVKLRLLGRIKPDEGAAV